ncbi:MFS transporter [Curvibacter gracilis]|uniref:MFS transporter n=1 Tax=Curvibacter gracilis TaxID=230310 RepID=UPI000A041F11|nr:MFS transporter [Curvibacter gracilis]
MSGSGMGHSADSDRSESDPIRGDAQATPAPLQPWALLGLTLGVTAIGVEGLVISPVLGDLASTFEASPAQAGWAVSAYGLALAGAAPIVGLWGDRVPRLTLLRAALGLFVLAGLLCALANSLGALVAARALCGAAAGAFLPACYAYVGDCTAFADRARAMGRVMAGWSLALTLGIPVGGLIAQWWGWRLSFVAVALLAAVAAWRVNRMPAAPLLRPLLRPSSPLSPPPDAAAPPLSAAGSGPPSRPRLDRAALPLLALNFFDMLSFYGVYTFLGVTVQARLQLGSGGFALFVACYGLGLMASTLNAGVLDRFGKTQVLRGALLLLACLLLLLAPATGHPTTLAAAMLCWGALQGLAQTGTATLVTQVSERARGLAMACLSCTTYLAVSLGSFGGGWVLTHHGFDALAQGAALCALLAGLLLQGWVRKAA